MDKIKTSPKDFFLHLLSSITLYMVAISFLMIVFQYINHFFPDVLNDYYYYDFSNGPMRFGISMLLVVFPVYFWTVLYLDKVYSKDPEKKNLRIRKWLIYFTVFVAAFIIIGDLISLVNSFLSGELTSRFLLKVLAVLVVALAIFSYYLLDIKENMTGTLKKIYAWVSIVLALGFVVAAFFVVGSPQSQRDLRMDQERTNDLMSIESAVNSYFAEKNSLPNSLALVAEEGRLSPSSISDPQTGEVYEYNVLDQKNYQLCVTFITKNIDTYQDYVQPRLADKYQSINFWQHDVGEKCFELEAFDYLKPVNTKL